MPCPIARYGSDASIKIGHRRACGEPGQIVEIVGRCTGLRQNRRVASGDLAATLPFHGPGHGRGPARRLTMFDELVEEGNEFVREPNRDLLAHTKMVPLWDALWYSAATSLTRYGSSDAAMPSDGVRAFAPARRVTFAAAWKLTARLACCGWQDRRVDRVSAFARSRRLLEYLDQHPRLLGVVERARRLLPGDPGYGDPLSISGARTSNVLGQQLANLASRQPSALRELGLGALQVWQAYASTRPDAVGTEEAALVFTDLGQFSEWTLKAGDDAAVRLLREVSAEVEPLIRRHGGRLVKRLGDGLMIVFAEADEALAFMLAAREVVDGLAADGDRPRLRCGAHLGHPSKLGGDYFGVDVNIAARVAAAAAPGEVLVSSAAHERLDTGGHHLRKRLWFRAKGVPADVRVYAVVTE